MARVWFITGASSGFGRTMTEFVLRHGDIAIATLRKPEVLDDLKAQYAADKLLTLKLDVTNLDEIAAAFTKAKEVFGRVDVVFNNAGYGMMAEVEGAPEDKARGMFDANFWGATNVSREAVKFFREVNSPAGGRLIVTSSLTACRTMPLMGYYSASKIALELVTEALSLELDPEWNIKITLIQLGGYETNGKDNSVYCPPPQAYTKATLPSAVTRSVIEAGALKLTNSVAKAVEKINQLSTLDDPPIRLALGKDAVQLARAHIAVVTGDLDKYESWSENLTSDA